MFIQGNMESINNFLKVISKGNNYNDLVNYKRLWDHSSLAVSLTYLRGLEVSELEEEDMPVM